ncbi:PaaI family thioesterase [Pseudoramibacter sp.]|jgi:acyl-CoA thioesterase|uniref:PaaI family thioesterase n=1 Tax=Pseudoramibacter sp. TaxID=2034862 RepID=UPI0025FE0365|nr:PaaI family thioesterase [Pseudoramibacter sp.]MCH4072549.1 PaaI family thioesterase [Pseudoramibacter sp.]MCH4106320.1 PaaI family thioesterase [Pseudoramibacter sp.]
MEKQQENLKKILAIRERENVFANEMGIRTKKIEDGYAQTELAVEPRHLNLNHSVHGGCLYTLADNAGGACASSCGYRVSTLSGDLQFMRPAINCKKLTATAKTRKAGKRIIVVGISIRDENQREIACGLFDYAKMKIAY